MSVPVEEGEHNGDNFDRAEEVRWLFWRLHASTADHISLGSWHYHSIRSYLSLPKAPPSDSEMEE